MKRTPYKDQVYLDNRPWREVGVGMGKTVCFGIVAVVFIAGYATYHDRGSEGPSPQEQRQLTDLIEQASGHGMTYQAEGTKLPLSETLPWRADRLGSQAADQPKPPAITEHFIQKVAMAESSGNPNAKLEPGKGSASGLFGFIDDTWRRMVERHGKTHGIGLKDKNHPRAQRVMARILLKENAASLVKLLDRTPTHGEIYMAHMFGPVKAAELIESKGTGKLAKNLFPRDVVRRNPAVFWKGKKPRTVEEVYHLLDRKVA